VSAADRLIVPNRGARRGGLTIYVPGRHADNPALDFVCRIPTKDGICGVRCDTLPAMEHHLRVCRSRHEQEIHEGTLKERIPIMHPDSWDPEAEAYLLGVGERMIREGRWHLRKNERIGT
jgi:hypothetical protein